MRLLGLMMLWDQESKDYYITSRRESIPLKYVGILRLICWSLHLCCHSNRPSSSRSLNIILSGPKKKDGKINKNRSLQPELNHRKAFQDYGS